MTRNLFCLLGLLSTAIVSSAAAQTPGPWDMKLRNSHGYVLKQKDIAYGGKPAMVNGEWQGNFRFELSNCPGAGCQSLAGVVVSTKTLTDYLGVYRFPGAACALHVIEGEDKNGYDDGFVLSLAPTDAGGIGCKAYPASMSGHYHPY